MKVRLSLIPKPFKKNGQSPFKSPEAQGNIHTCQTFIFMNFILSPEIFIFDKWLLSYIYLDRRFVLFCFQKNLGLKPEFSGFSSQRPFPDS